MPLSDAEFDALAAAPRETRTDEGFVQERSVQELIAADRYAKTQAATTQAVPFGLRYAKFKPPGTL